MRGSQHSEKSMRTMNPQFRNIQSELEASLKSLAKEKGNEIAIRIRPILYTNLDRGRIQGFTEGKTNRVHDYVWRVATQYELLHSFIRQLQVERSSDVWGTIFISMEKWAYNFLMKERYNIASLENAAECATEASITILDAYFPYDVDFETWAHVVVQHVCQKFVRKIRKKSAIPEESLVSLDDTLENFKNPLIQDEMQQKDLQRTLLEIIAQLPPSRREVIELIYFRELSPKEVAKIMKKSVGAIYNLHFNALQDMQKILSENRDIFNE